MKDIKVFLKRKKRQKSDNVVAKDTKIYRKIKNKSLTNIEKHCEMRKTTLLKL